MTMVLVLILFAAALALSGKGVLADPVGARLARLVPERADGVGESRHKLRHLELAYRILAAVDPTFKPGEALLRSLGIVHPEWIVAIGLAKLGFAFIGGIAAAWLAGVVFGSGAAQVIALLAVSGGLIVGINGTIRAASLNRRARVRKELAFGIEMLCIFLEGGQSLDQAFRSFADVCGEALPHIAVIQRRLIAELNNGVPYEKAIEHWAESLSADEAKPLAALFVDSLVHGTELVPHLRQFSVELVEQRIATLRAGIGVKSSQLTVVMVVFFLPAILAFVTAPAISGVATALELSR